MIDKLEMFIALANERHFGRAAETCGVAQPSLSSAIRQLEDQLGVQLVFRGSRFQGLTPEGQRVLDWARRIVGDMRALKDEMRTVHRGLSGNLRLGVIPTALPMIADLTAPFTARHPNLRVTILSRTSVEILAMLDNLEIDAGISYLDNEPMGRVSTEPLYEERYMLVCAADAPLAGRPSVGWQELEGERLCLLTPDMQNRRIINRAFAAVDVTPDAVIESNSTLVLLATVEQGGWMTVLSEDNARFLARGKALSVVPLVGLDTVHTVGLVAPFREPHTPVLEALLREARRMSEIA